MSVQVSYKKQITFFLIMLLIVLIITEVFVRFVEIIEPQPCKIQTSSILSNLSTSELADMCHEYNHIEFDVQSPIRLLEPDQKGKFININSDGFRGQELDFKYEDYRIFLLGGSTMFGIISTSDKTTIQGYLQEKLNKISFSKNIKVVNAGIEGSISIDELYYLKNTILNYNPNLIVMYDGFNESLYFRGIVMPYEEFIKNTHLENRQLFLQNQSEVGTGIIKFFEKIDYQTALGIAAFLKDFSHNISTPKIQDSNFDRTNRLDEKKLATIENNTKTNWSKVCELGKTNGFQVVNILQPMLGTSDRILHPEEIEIMQTRGFPDWGLYWNNVEINNDRVSACENIHDFRNVFAGMDEVLLYFDRGHVVDFGNEIVAEQMFETLVPIIENDIKK